jgi:PAS domain S-box-containing protein
MNMSTTQTSQSLIEGMSYVVIAVDNDGIITLWNKAAELTLGFEANEALGQHASHQTQTFLLHDSNRQINSKLP